MEAPEENGEGGSYKQQPDLTILQALPDIGCIMRILYGLHLVTATRLHQPREACVPWNYLECLW